MSLTFRAPVASYTPCEADTLSAIDAFLASFKGQACLRVDCIVSNTTIQAIDKTTVSVHAIGDEGVLHYHRHSDLGAAQRPLFLEALAAINDDSFLAPALEGYPIPWNDGRYCKIIQGRHLSLLFFGAGFGAVVAEYIPHFLDTGVSIETSGYFDADAPACDRCEIMSLYMPEDPGNHQRLQREVHLQTLKPIAAAMFQYHCHGDTEVPVSFADIDPRDRLS